MSELPRRSVLAIALALATPIRASAAERALGEFENYLRNLETLQADFAQIGPDGSLRRGVLYLHRPWRMRIEYAPPSKDFVVAPGDWRLVVWDGAVEQANVLPIAETPLGVILAEEVDFEGADVGVVDLRRSAGETAITLVRREAPDQGSVTLVFADEPIALRRWSVVDAQGATTRVVLENVRVGASLDPSLFRFSTIGRSSPGRTEN